MIKNIDKRIIDKGFHTGYEVDFVTIQQSDYEYLKEQSERVEDLEETIEDYKKINKDRHRRVSELRKRNKRYHEALKFYADERNYEDIGIPTGSNPPALPILEDRGQVARKELEGEE